jgi:hypothetical protein
MNTEELQTQIFQHIKTKLPAEASMVDEVARTLDVSTDSAYRRIRGEKALSLEELYKLCVQYRLSLDHLLNLHGDVFLFTGNFLKAEDPAGFRNYLNNIVQQVKYISSFADNQMIYLAKDIPLFHHFHSREIAAFKYYFWMKNILHLPGFANKKFKIDDYPDEYFELGSKALEYYNRTHSIEVWNIESINSTLRQVEFYHDSNIFSSEYEIYILYEALEKLLEHLEHQATEGYKFDAGDESFTPRGSYQMYFNEIVILENSILATLNGSRAAYLVHNVVNVMITRDVQFCDNMYRYIQNLLKKSTLISTVSERERFRFFKFLRQRINNRKQGLKV